MSIIGTKVPDENKDYSIDWTKDLGADTITISTWTVSPSDVSITSSNIAGSSILTTVWLSGGVSGQVYEVRNFIATSSGRNMEKTFRLLVEANNYL